MNENDCHCESCMKEKEQKQVGRHFLYLVAPALSHDVSPGSREFLHGPFAERHNHRGTQTTIARLFCRHGGGLVSADPNAFWFVALLARSESATSSTSVPFRPPSPATAKTLCVWSGLRATNTPNHLTHQPFYLACLQASCTVRFDCSSLPHTEIPFPPLH